MQIRLQKKLFRCWKLLLVDIIPKKYHHVTIFRQPLGPEWQSQNVFSLGTKQIIFTFLCLLS